MLQKKKPDGAGSGVESHRASFGKRKPKYPLRTYHKRCKKEKPDRFSLSQSSSAGSNHSYRAASMVGYLPSCTSPSNETYPSHGDFLRAGSVRSLLPASFSRMPSTLEPPSRVAY